MKTEKDDLELYRDVLRLIKERSRLELSEEQRSILEYLDQLVDQYRNSILHKGTQADSLNERIYLELKHLSALESTGFPVVVKKGSLLSSAIKAVSSPLGALSRTFGGQKAAMRNCELILSLLLNKAEQEPAIGDFLERYEQKCQRLGRRRTDLWAYSEVLRTVWPVLKRKLGTLLKLFIAADWVRRQFHQ